MTYFLRKTGRIPSRDSATHPADAAQHNQRARGILHLIFADDQGILTHTKERNLQDAQACD